MLHDTLIFDKLHMQFLTSAPNFRGGGVS